MNAGNHNAKNMEYRDKLSALNRIEGYHQLLSKIGSVHDGKFQGSTENELRIWNECCR